MVPQSSKYKMSLLFPEQKQITQKALYFVTSIVGAGNREGKSE